jgi:hypothetical protein
MSSPLSPSLLGLAPELVANVFKQLNDKSDLSNARLTCKIVDKYAVKELFKDVFVSPSEEHIIAWNKVSQDDVIRQIPRHVVIHTQPEIDDDEMEMSQERFEVDIADEDALTFENALTALSRFPNLDSVEIGFTPGCVGRDQRYYQEVAENVSEREEAMTLIFQAIKNRAADENNRTIRKLTIINLQNCPIPEFTSSDLFRDVMAQLEELHLSITQEFNRHGPDNDSTKIEVQTFPAYLCSHWLAPISANLKALSIYTKSDNWGPFPGSFDPSGISFPKLEVLALGYYTLAHEKDFDWVLAIKSLRKLILHNCMICSWMNFEPENFTAWNVRTDDWTKMSAEDADPDAWTEDFAYAGKWSELFDRIAGSLPDLINFQFGYQSTYDEPSYKVTNRGICPVGIFAQRYICFDNCILPTHWPEPEDDGQLHCWLDDGFPINVHEEYLEADQKSLDALLRKLRSRD